MCSFLKYVCLAVSKTLGLRRGIESLWWHTSSPSGWWFGSSSQEWMAFHLLIWVWASTSSCPPFTATTQMERNSAARVRKFARARKRLKFLTRLIGRVRLLYTIGVSSWTWFVIRVGILGRLVRPSLRAGPPLFWLCRGWATSTAGSGSLFGLWSLQWLWCSSWFTLVNLLMRLSLTFSFQAWQLAGEPRSDLSIAASFSHQNGECGSQQLSCAQQR